MLIFCGVFIKIFLLLVSCQLFTSTWRVWKIIKINLNDWIMEEWEHRLEITSHPVDQKIWVRVPSTTLKKWVEYGPISSRGCLLDEPASQWEACIYIHVQNLFVWCNHYIPELLIFTYSATPHLWALFPFFHGLNPVNKISNRFASYSIL